MDDPDLTVILEILGENNLPIIVTSDSDAPGAAGTLRDAIIQANSQPGVNTIEFAANLTGSTGDIIDLQASLPVVSNDLNVVGSIDVNPNGYAGLQFSATHTVTEYDGGG